MAKAPAKKKPKKPRLLTSGDRFVIETNKALKEQGLNTKTKMGRPSKYDPSYCDLVIEMGKEGASLAVMGSAIGVDRVTLLDWAKVHPEFSTALRLAKLHEQAWWEKIGVKGLTADKFNAMVWKVSMQARFRDDYTEQRRTEISGPDGGPLQVEARNALDVALLTPEEREQLKLLLLAAKQRKEGIE